MFVRVMALAAIAMVFSTASAAQTAGSSKIGLINSVAFTDEKAGITKYNNGIKQLNTEFGPLRTELETMNLRLQTLTKEIEGLRKLPAASQASLQTKFDEAQKLERDIKFKSEDAQSKLSRRQQQVLGPIQDSIWTALQEFAKQKGFTLIFDSAKDQNGLLVAVGDQTADVTKDFITYYNAKP